MIDPYRYIQKRLIALRYGLLVRSNVGRETLDWLDAAPLCTQGPHPR